MKNKVIITTTNSIENAEIEKYIELISTNVVIGTNFFSDLGASLTDLFGGFSDSYQNKLQTIYKVAIDNLKDKASNIGANAIVGLKLDFDEISGKGKSMFMISAIGTAVSIKFKLNIAHKEENISVKSFVGFNELTNEITKRRIIEDLSANKIPSQEDWLYLANYPIQEIIESLLSKYLYVYPKWVGSRSENETQLVENMPLYIKLMDNEDAIELLYPKIVDHETAILDLVETNRFFSPLKVMELLRSGNLKLAIKCLRIDKESYTQSDLNEMQEIISFFDNLPDKGKIESVKGMFSKVKECYICPNGHTNDRELEFCSTIDCYQNIKGLTTSEINTISNFRLKVNALSSMLNKEFAN